MRTAQAWNWNQIIHTCWFRICVLLYARLDLGSICQITILSVVVVVTLDAWHTDSWAYSIRKEYFAVRTSEYIFRSVYWGERFLYKLVSAIATATATMLKNVHQAPWPGKLMTVSARQWPMSRCHICALEWNGTRSTRTRTQWLGHNVSTWRPMGHMDSWLNRK